MLASSTTSRWTTAKVPRRSRARPRAGRSSRAAAPDRTLGYRLTSRAGPKVERESFKDLDAAVAALRDRAEHVLADGPLPGVKVLRDFEPEQRVAARLEISTGGWLRGRAAGVDVMGDGSVVAFSGGVRRARLAPQADESPYDAVRRELSE